MSIENVSDADFRAEARSPEVAGRLDRLKTAVRAAGGNRVVVERSGIPASRLTAYLGGEEMKLSRAIALAEACDVRVDWLATGRGHMAVNPMPATIKLTGQGETDGEVTLTVQNFAIIPRYAVRASAGGGNLVEEERLAGYLAIEDNFLRQVLHRRRQDLTSIEATGDSMEPSIQDGDLLIIDTAIQDIQNSRIYVLEVNGGVIVKRLALRLDGSIEVRSDNPKYSVEVVTPSERNTLRLIGQVVYQAGPVRS